MYLYVCVRGGGLHHESHTPCCSHSNFVSFTLCINININNNNNNNILLYINILLILLLSFSALNVIFANKYPRFAINAFAYYEHYFSNRFTNCPYLRTSQTQPKRPNGLLNNTTIPS